MGESTGVGAQSSMLGVSKTCSQASPEVEKALFARFFVRSKAANFQGFFHRADVFLKNRENSFLFWYNRTYLCPAQKRR